MARVNLEVEPETKEKWEDYADNDPNSGGNLSALIRNSVAKEIEGQHSGGELGTKEILTRMGELGDQLSQVADRMESMESRLSSLETETTTEPEIEELKGDVFDLLPSVEPGTDRWERERIDLHDEAQATGSDSVKAQSQAWKGTVEGVANALDEPEYMVARAIERLQETTKLIRTTEIDGETRYYKVV